LFFTGIFAGVDVALSSFEDIMVSAAWAREFMGKFERNSEPIHALAAYLPIDLRALKSPYKTLQLMMNITNNNFIVEDDIIRERRPRY
jgi:hypothetical protein